MMKVKRKEEKAFVMVLSVYSHRRICVLSTYLSFSSLS